MTDHITLQMLQQRAFNLIQTALGFMGVEQVSLREFRSHRGNTFLCRIRLQAATLSDAFYAVENGFCEDVLPLNLHDTLQPGWFQAELVVQASSLFEVQ
ncbi:MAG: hypothetical protein IT322_20775 [Anaerolineae bacterium]|nr:hypothetical protein [Anaerolineae bacterium]